MSDTPPRYPLAAFGGEPPPAPEWFTEALAHPPERRRISVDGVEVETLSWGRVGDPGLLLLHGAMANAEWWSHLAPRLAQGRRVTAISNSGMGQSDWRDAYSLDIHAGEALAAAEETGLFASDLGPTCIGHSFGGHALLQMASLWGDRFERAVLLDSLAGTPTSPPRHHVNAGDFPSAAAALARFRLLPSQEAEPYILDWFGRSGLKTLSRPDGGQRTSWRFDPDFFIKFEPFDDQASLTKAKCPLIFLRGEASQVCSAAVEVQQRVGAPAGTVFLSIPEATHHVMADQPLRLNEVLEGLLRCQPLPSVPSQTEPASHDFRTSHPASRP